MEARLYWDWKCMFVAFRLQTVGLVKVEDVEVEDVEVEGVEVEGVQVANNAEVLFKPIRSSEV